MPLLEIACFNAESAFIASASGADRIELCKDRQLGGTTPLLSVFREVKKKAGVSINVMIRPRGGNFTYDAEEFHLMEVQIGEFRDAGADGFVFGILKGRTIDFERCRHLVTQARAPCTFHRAFDEISEEDMLQRLEVLIDCGFKSVLTSGGQANAIEGCLMLKRLVEAASGRIDIIVGGGVRSHNLQDLKRGTGGNTFHSSAIVEGDDADRNEIATLKSIVHQR